jgi:hypothetical protein
VKKATNKAKSGAVGNYRGKVDKAHGDGTARAEFARGGPVQKEKKPTVTVLCPLCRPLSKKAPVEHDWSRFKEAPKPRKRK